MTNDGGTFLKALRPDGDCQSSAKTKNASGTQPVSLTIGGHPALQDELTGTEKGTNVVFLHTTIDDGDYFQQTLAWTLKSRWEKQNQLLREITRTFHSEK